jgi:uncharacterized UBP type Zn finger protein
MRHFSLDLPPTAGSTAQRPPPDLQGLLNAFFAPDAVEVACEKCDGRSATVEHRIVKLPRVLTLHLKRFDHSSAGVRKRLDTVRPLPKFVYHLQRAVSPLGRGLKRMTSSAERQ